MAKWSVSEILTIGDKNAKQNVEEVYCPLPSLSATPSPKETAKIQHNRMSLFWEKKQCEL